MTIRKLRTIDLIIFTAIGILLDVVVGLEGFFGIAAFVSIGIPLVVLCYIRWEKIALISNLALALVHLFLYDAPFLSRLAHSLALLTLALAILVQRLPSFRATRMSLLQVMGLYAGLYLVMILTEWGLLQVFNLPVPFVNMVLNHIINLGIGAFLLLLMALQKELLVHMDPYLREKSEENKQHE